MCVKTSVCADAEQLAEYRSSLGTMGQDTNAHYTGEAYSVWDGSYAFGKHKEKAVFVDENACIGCMVRVCVCVSARVNSCVCIKALLLMLTNIRNCRRCRCCCFINTYALCRIVFTARRNHSQLSQSMAALASWHNGLMTGTNSTWHSTAVPCRAFIGSTSRTCRCSNMRCAPWIEHTLQDSCTAPRHRKIVPIHSRWPRT